MASKEFIELFKNTASKVVDGKIANKENEHIIVKHFYQAFSPFVSTKFPVVKNTQDLSLFLDKLEELHNKIMEFYGDDRVDHYWDEKEFEEYVLAHTFFRATMDDFENPISYLDREISFLNFELAKDLEASFSDFKIGSFSYDKYSDIDIKVFFTKNLIGYESNHCISIDLMNADYTSDDAFSLFHLPDVHFDIDKDTVYIKGIQATETRTNDKKDSWCKKISRTTYLVNKDFDGDEDLAKVPPTHLLSLSIIISSLQKQGYNKFAFPTYHPVRNINYVAHHAYEVDKKCSDKDVERKKKLNDAMKKVDFIQHNLTDRFLFTVLRYVDHFPGTEIINYGDDNMGYLVIDTSKQLDCDNDHILHAIHNGMSSKEYGR